MAAERDSTKQLKADESEVVRALKLLFEPKQVFEIRALGGALGRPLSGYFGDFDKATRAALEVARRGAEAST